VVTRFLGVLLLVEAVAVLRTLVALVHQQYLAVEAVGAGTMEQLHLLGVRVELLIMVHQVVRQVPFKLLVVLVEAVEAVGVLVLEEVFSQELEGLDYLVVVEVAVAVAARIQEEMEHLLEAVAVHMAVLVEQVVLGCMVRGAQLLALEEQVEQGFWV